MYWATSSRGVNQDMIHLLPPEVYMALNGITATARGSSLAVTESCLRQQMILLDYQACFWLHPGMFVTSPGKALWANYILSYQDDIEDNRAEKSIVTTRMPSSSFIQGRVRGHLFEQIAATTVSSTGRRDT